MWPTLVVLWYFYLMINEPRRFVVISKKIFLPDECECVSRYDITNFLNSKMPNLPEFFGRIEVCDIVKVSGLNDYSSGISLRQIREGYTLE